MNETLSDQKTIEQLQAEPDSSAPTCSPRLTFTAEELERKAIEWGTQQAVTDDEGDMHPQSEVEIGILKAFARSLFASESAKGDSQPPTTNL